MKDMWAFKRRLSEAKRYLRMRANNIERDRINLERNIFMVDCVNVSNLLIVDHAANSNVHFRMICYAVYHNYWQDLID